MPEVKESSHRKALLSICWKLGVTKEHCSSYYGCVTNFSKTQWCKTTIDCAPGLCGTVQEFGQCTAGTAWLCFTMPGASDRRFAHLGLESPAGSSTPMSGG